MHRTNMSVLTAYSMFYLVEPDLLDGWTQFHIRMMDDAQAQQIIRLQTNYGLFGFFIFLLILSFIIEMYVVRKMLANYRFTEQGIFGILHTLPAYARRIPQIAGFLKNAGDAGADEAAEAGKALTSVPEDKDGNLSSKDKLASFSPSGGDDAKRGRRRTSSLKRKVVLKTHTMEDDVIREESDHSITASWDKGISSGGSLKRSISII
ncbi:hypothetical protein HK405_010831 [Cladochytrium tenue]|nr:hypothetical protein HK405_010831 [Cladochytrium tenue]